MDLRKDGRALLPQSVRELWTGKDVPVSELGKFKLNGGYFVLSGIK